MVEILISDTGIGIPEDIMDKIFDPFFTTKEEGNGIGLSIVHGIIEQHGEPLLSRAHWDTGRRS